MRPLDASLLLFAFRSLRYLSTEHGYKALSLVATLSATAFGNSLILSVFLRLDVLFKWRG
jgi:hypothetical protein